MAMEDAMALEVLLSKVSAVAEVEQRLKLYNSLRLPRVSAAQTMSNKMMGPPANMIDEVRQYYDGHVPGPTAKTFDTEYNDFFFLYNVSDDARKLMHSD